MVLYKREALADLENIRLGLLNWNKIQLTEEFVIAYMFDIKTICDALDKKRLHHKATYDDHKKFGTYIHSYKRNSSTMWYIVYNVEGDDIFVNKILNNYQTVS
ncbi:MAG: hypothetical protein LBV31_00045 [Prevotellaceae bacterium]|jgi:hypothetical protein|nr:hypothetical protein [Prevotellaceae bacterium]